MKYAYFPGCNAESTALEYNQSVKETLNFLGVELQDIPNWNCCGASSSHVIDQDLALALPGRNLALAEQISLDMITPCPACFVRQKTAWEELKKNRDLKTKIETLIGLPLKLNHQTKHVLEVVYHEIGTDLIRKKISRPLKGLKVVTYYGCYLVRPPDIADFDDPENPISMDEIMESLGAEVVDWSCKIDCCGASLSLTTAAVAEELVSKIIGNACELGAQAIVTACPLCQFNLDVHQSNSQPLPVLFFSELTALALGSLRANKWFGKHMVNPSGLFEKLGLI
ncbi:MAG: CoB--CoM heterodisulfide reductase iron-sulfur subunit B family protein [Candidatus Tectomicrobia bacterium]|uniref:CoB--CoM heterodisulfide reductase iron-sulfur subunit B family protein n=1 Tax=Tectimicrobiota bacterium TaxID=2528274 RepID=A0A933LPM9_UNCTE|nr:CoB--CoM heterodisulfide reductase iron-sulfur subunit B family protein [Candidatus Tectomicrobia bacterium]